MLKIILAAGALLAFALPSWAQSTPTAQAVDNGSREILDIVIDEAQKRVIKEYYDKRAETEEKDDDKESDAAEKEDDDDGKSKDKAAKGKGKGKEKSKGKGRGDGLPPGLAKRDQLPPGLAKRGNQLPAGLTKSELPEELEDQLPDLPEEAERVVVDDDVLLIEKGTGVILDVLEGVIRGQGQQ